MVSTMAAKDQSSALASPDGYLVRPRFHATRHRLEQNRPCSRRGTNCPPQ
jgi:hypothetical protein